MPHESFRSWLWLDVETLKRKRNLRKEREVRKSDLSEEGGEAMLEIASKREGRKEMVESSFERISGISGTLSRELRTLSGIRGH
jgi:hypothetical protein